MSLTELSKEQIKKIKEEYPSGAEIIVDRMADDPRPVAPGTQGTVIAVDDIGTLHCNFNGRQLGVIPGVDSFHKKPDAVSYDRLLQILQDYVNNDAEAAEEGYVRSILKDICGVNKEEAEQLGLGYLFDAEEEEEEEK